MRSRVISEHERRKCCLVKPRHRFSYQYHENIKIHTVHQSIQLKYGIYNQGSLKSDKETNALALFQQILKKFWLKGDFYSWEINLFKAKGKITILFTTEFLVIPSQYNNIKAYKNLSKYTMQSKSFEHFHLKLDRPN